jgi:hypothetical protein
MVEKAIPGKRSTLLRDLRDLLRVVEERVDRRRDDASFDGQNLDADEREAREHVDNNTFVEYTVQNFGQT